MLDRWGNQGVSTLKEVTIESEVLRESALMDSVLAARDQQVSSSCITRWYHS